ncbi:MAG: MBL fold metallo-hydrolase [Chlamydiales bacterium]
MMIHTFPSGPLLTNAYVIECENTKQCAIIDPGIESFDSITTLVKDRDLKVQCIILTHSHWDHTSGVAKLKNYFKTPLWAHPDDKENVEHPGSDGLPMLYAIEATNVDKELFDNEIFSIGSIHWKVIHTPGHSPGGICLYSSEDKVLISGDTLFKGSIGNLSFSTAEPEKMWHSLDKLKVLPPETRVYPGHGETTTIKQEDWLPNARALFGYA